MHKARSRPREPKSKKSNSSPAHSKDLLGTVFLDRHQDICVLLYQNGWVMCSAWGGWKRSDITEPGFLKRVDGLVDGMDNKNFFNAKNYYWRQNVVTKAKTTQSLLNAMKSLGYKVRNERTIL